MQLYSRKLSLLKFFLQLRSAILVVYMHVLLNWTTISNLNRDPQIRYVTSENGTCYNITQELIAKIPYAIELNKRHNYISDFFEQLICTYLLGTTNTQLERWLLLLATKEIMYHLIRVSEFLKIIIVCLTGGFCVVVCKDL